MVAPTLKLREVILLAPAWKTKYRPEAPERVHGIFIVTFFEGGGLEKFAVDALESVFP